MDDADLGIFEHMRINNPRRYRIEGLGDWGIAEGLIYENVEQKDFDIDDIRTKDGVIACFGLDFGFTDPTAFVACMVDNSTKTIYVFDEWYKTKVTNKQIAESLVQLGYGSQLIICDSAK